MTRASRAVLVDEVSLLTVAHELVPPGWTIETSTVVPEGADIAALAVSPDTASVRAPHLDRLPGLRLLAATSAGTDHLDVHEARRRGIEVISTPDYCTDEVADHTVTLVLGLLRQTHRLDHAVRTGHWHVGRPRPRRVAGAVLGLWGCGATGTAVARRALALGMRVITHHPRGTVAHAEIEQVSWDELLRACDVLSLHVPLTEQTRGRIDAAALAALRPGSFLVNTARGGLIDEHALDAALRHGHLAGAALDVLATEPPAPDHPLARTPGLVVTPHAAWVSDTSIHLPFRRFARALHALG